MNRNLFQWLDYLETLNPKSIDLTLTRIAEIAKRMGGIQFHCPVVTVGGTNGKGSCVTLLKSILIAQGLRVGSYISPHLIDFCERIQINGEYISETLLCEQFQKIEVARGDILLTYFEYVTLAALQIFQTENLDCIILEVGLGGRLDAVNLIDPDIAVITSISLDHCDWLGDTREQIGAEKAGILRAGKPFVSGERDLPQTVLEKAKHLPTWILGRDFDFETPANTWTFKTWHPSDTKNMDPSFRWGDTPSCGDTSSCDDTPSCHEATSGCHASEGWHPGVCLQNLPKPKLLLQNAATALMVITLLQTFFPISETAIATGLKNAFIPGRFQTIHNTIFDVAHNPESANMLAIQLQNYPCPGKTYFVCSMLKDKDHAESFKPLASLADEWFIAPLSNPRAAMLPQLENALKTVDIQTYTTYPNIKEAYQKAQEKAKPQDRIVVFGSFYTVAELMSLQ